MQIAIISDTHDHIPNIEKCFEHIKALGIETILHAGDTSKAETLDRMATIFHGNIHLVSGNSDIDEDELNRMAEIYPTVSYNHPSFEATLDGLRVFMAHKPKDVGVASGSGKYDLVIHGHTHKPWQSFAGKTEILCPGNLADQRYPATFATYDTQTRNARLIQLSRI